MTYNALSAVDYAHQWAYARNPKYGTFDEIGGDCTNFVSQCLYAGGLAMQRGPNGWYFLSMTDRAPAWTGVYFLARYLREGGGRPPIAREVPLETALAGDVVMLSFDAETFTHAALVVARRAVPGPDGILVAAHTIDSDNRPLSTYAYRATRLFHLLDSV